MEMDVRPMDSNPGLSQGSKMLSLPLEILEEIWSKRQLDEKDLSRLAAVCSRFRSVSNSNEVWKNKIRQRWPKCFSVCLQSTRTDWQRSYHHRLVFHRSVRELVSKMSAQNFHKEDMSHTDFQQFTDMMSAYKHGMTFLVDELLSVLKDHKIHENLTDKYYAEKVLRHVRHCHLKKELQDFMKLPPNMQLVEKGASLLSQWCQPVSAPYCEAVSDQLDEIADAVRRQLGKDHPGHPACEPVTTPLIDIEDNLWSLDQCKAVLGTINKVLYTQIGFKGNNSDYYDPKNSYIDKVLERKVGIPITLCIVYMAVARRLGIVCYPVNFPSHFLIKWQEHPNFFDNRQWTFIDAFNGGKFMTESECKSIDRACPYLGEGCLDTVSFTKVLERMARNLMSIGHRRNQSGDGTMCIRTAAELFLILCPEDLDAKIMLIRIYMHCKVNLGEVVDLLQELASHENPFPNQDSEGLIGFLSHTAQEMLLEQHAFASPPLIKGKLLSKSKEVIYSVGMIMRHRRYNYTCVIYGWDSKCEASPEWMHQMGVHNLPRKHQQPFYNVLVEDGSNRYAAQENLEPAAFPKVITHSEIGRYFKQYCHWCYLPNEEKKRQYPEDNARTAKLVQEHYNVNPIPGVSGS